MRELRGKVAVVTGGASGIGRALAEAFCREGTRVVIGDVEEPALTQAVSSLGREGASVMGVRADVSRAADVEALRDQALSAFGAVHVVCNNAGIATAGTVDGTPPERWCWTLDVNLWGVIHGCRAFLPLLRQQREGHIVNTASIAALAGHPMLGAYTASKFAVAGLSESLHHELEAAGSPVRVSLFCPGPVQTSIRDSERNRPAHVPPAIPRPGTAEATPAAADTIPGEMPAAQAAAAVLRGIRDERFWIFTHPEITRREIQARAAWMLNDANTASLDPPLTPRKLTDWAKRQLARGAVAAGAVSVFVYLIGARRCGSLRRMPDELVPDDAAGLRAANAGLRAVVEARAAEIAGLRAELDASRERERRLELRLAELERRLGMDSTDSGTPSSKERIGAREARRARQQSERERRKDRRPGGQPGHQGKGLARDPEPDVRKDAPPPAECRRCGTGLGGAEPAGDPRWAQVVDVGVVRTVTEVLLPGLSCPCCGTATFAEPPPGAHAGAVSYGPVLNAAAVLLSCYGNVPPERAAQLIGMLLGTEVSAGWVDKAAARVSAQLGKAGFDDAMLAALTAEDVLAADETPVNVLDKTAAPAVPDEKDEADPEEKQEKAAAGAAHVLITRTPDGRLTFLQAMASRRKAALAAGLPASFTGYLITDGYTGYQHLLSRLAGIQQCAAHVIRRCRAVTKLGPGGVQNWAGDIITILREAHQAVETARARGDTALDQQVIDDLRERYDTAVSSGIIHNRLRAWHDGNHPGYTLGCWLRGYKEQVFLFTRNFAVDWTNNVSERGAKAAKRHQAVSGYWHSLATLGRWCRLRSYLDSAAAHGIPALDAVAGALAGKPWLPPLPATI